MDKRKVEFRKEEILEEIENVKQNLIILNEERDCASNLASKALDNDDIETFESYSDEFVALGKRIMSLCSYLNVLSKRYTKLVLKGYEQKKDTSIKVACSTLGHYLETLKENNVICIPYINGEEYKVKDFIKSKNYKIYKDCFIKKITLNLPDFEYGILISIDNVD